jgi:hypothetical protein
MIEKTPTNNNAFLQMIKKLTMDNFQRLGNDMYISIYTINPKKVGHTYMLH